jgi:hypothetical protein
MNNHFLDNSWDKENKKLFLKNKIALLERLFKVVPN